jgi:hypothetical protein
MSEQAKASNRARVARHRAKKRGEGAASLTVTVPVRHHDDMKRLAAALSANPDWEVSTAPIRNTKTGRLTRLP